MESKKRNLKEATENVFTAEELERVLKIDEESGYELGIIAQPKDSETPFAWDAGISISNDGLVTIDGNFMPGGPEAGTVNIKCKFDSFKRHFDLRCDYDAIDSADISDEDKDLVRSLCDPY